MRLPAEHLLEAWYSGARWTRVMVPLEWLYRGAVRRRRSAAARSTWRAPVPVVVVGNLTPGGTGKTPLVIALAEALRARGLRVGVLSRGYGGRARRVHRVRPDSDPRQSGDEPVLLAGRLDCPVWVGRDRIEAARTMLAAEDVDAIVCDDGLQHYALARDVEICVVDGARGLGNGRCLPVGPLREPAERLLDVDFVLCTGNCVHRLPRCDGLMRLAPAGWTRLVNGRPPAAGELEPGGAVHAVAGIGNPQRFFATLRSLGLRVFEHPFPDHHHFEWRELMFGDELPVVMTEKDAVKCRGFALPNWWSLRVVAVLPDDLVPALMRRIDELPDGPAR